MDNHFNYSAIHRKHLHTGHAINMGEYPNVVRIRKTITRNGFSIVVERRLSLSNHSYLFFGRDFS